MVPFSQIAQNSPAGQHARSGADLLRARIILPLAAALMLGALLARFMYGGTLYLTFFTDDFFYYLLVARNLVLHHASTFNGLQLTNGYHPLWLLTLTILYALTRGSIWFFVILMVLIWLLLCGACRFLMEAQQTLFSGKVASRFTLPCVLFSTLFMAVVSRTGMEVSLAVFFLALLWKRLAAAPLETQSTSGALASGLIACCVVLSRLDAALIIAVYLTLAVAAPHRRFSRLCAFCAGLFPVALYILTNFLWFHTILPVSAMAKNLKPLAHPSASVIRSLLHPNAIQVAFAWPSILIAVAFAVLAARRRRTLNRVQFCVLLHPVLFYAVLSFTSDWQLWTWYLYPLVPVAALLGPEILAAIPAASQPMFRRYFAAAVLLLFVATTAAFTRINPAELLVYENGLDLERFGATHPGIYAMGDAAGTPAYLLNQPLLLLEGLMADSPFLDRIRRREPLLEALDELHANYYVTNKYRYDAGCFLTREPSKAGPLSPVMSAQLCVAPIARLSRPHGDLLVFDLHGIPAH